MSHDFLQFVKILSEKEKMPPVTIKEIARRAGLARSTVSEILSGKNNYCSEENRKKVRKIADELGYRPNIGFRIMTNRDTATYSIIFSQERTYHTESDQQLAFRLLRKIEALSGNAYTKIFDDNAAANLERTRELLSRGCRHFIFLGYPVGQKDVLQLLRQENCHYSSFNGFYGEGCGQCLRVDYSGAFREYFKYFLNRQQKFKLLQSLPFFNKTCLPLCEEFNIDPADILLEIPSLEHVAADCSAEYHRIIHCRVTDFISQNQDPHGWICGSDIEALGAVSVLLQAGLPVADEYGPLICGFGNTAAARFSPIPRVTTELNLDKVVAFLMDGLGNSADMVVCHKPEMVINSVN